MFEGNYIFYFVMVAIVAASASYFTAEGLKSDEYKSAKKPSWYPEGYVFGIAWTLIYLLYVYSWTQASYHPLTNSLFAINMVLNLLWTITFFYLKNWLLALLILLGLSILIMIQMNSMFKYDVLATVLLLPYLGWSIFATYLNYTIIDMN